MITEDDAPALFELEHPPRPRPGSAGYLASIAGSYDGMQGRAHWALVDVYEQFVIALDPEPLSPSVREQLAGGGAP